MGCSVATVTAVITAGSAAVALTKGIVELIDYTIKKKKEWSKEAEEKEKKEKEKLEKQLQQMRQEMENMKNQIRSYNKSGKNNNRDYED